MARVRVWSGCQWLGFVNIELESPVGTSRSQLSLAIESQERNVGQRHEDEW